MVRSSRTVATRGGWTPWLRPTLRATRWWPLAVATAAAAAVVVVEARHAAGPPTPLLGGILLAALTAGLALGLADPAHDLLAPLPSGVAARLLHRLVPLTAATTAAALTLEELAARAAPAASGARVLPWSGSPSVHLSGVALVALAATAVATYAVTVAHRPDLAPPLAASIPVAWVLSATLSDGTETVAPVASLWLDHPGPVLVGAVATAAVALTGVRSPGRTAARRFVRATDR